MDWAVPFRMVVSNDAVLLMCVPAADAVSLSRSILQAVHEHTVSMLPCDLEWAGLPGVRFHVVETVV